MRRLEPNPRRFPRLQSLLPAGHAQAPLIAWFQSRKVILRHGRGKIVASLPAESEKLGIRFHADRVQAYVAGARPAVAVAIKAGHRFAAAALQRLSEDIRGMTHGRNLAKVPPMPMSKALVTCRSTR